MKASIKQRVNKNETRNKKYIQMMEERWWKAKDEQKEIKKLRTKRNEC